MPVTMPATPESGGGFFENYLPHLLALAATSAAKGFDRELRKRNVSVAVWRVVAVLLERPGETVTDLAKRCLLQQPTTSKLVDRMERDQLIRRRKDERDHRVVRLSLTAEGITLA